MSGRRKNSLTSVSSFDSSVSREKKINKVATLFEIPRPKKNHRALKRTHSLPSQNRPRVLDSYQKSKEMEALVDEHTCDHADKQILPGRVKMLKEQLEKAGITYQKIAHSTNGDRKTKLNHHFINREHSIPFSEPCDFYSTENIYEEIPDQPKSSEKTRNFSLDTNLELVEVGENIALDLDTEEVFKNCPVLQRIDSFDSFQTSPDDNSTYEEVPYDYGIDDPIYENLPPYRNLNDNMRNLTVKEQTTSEVSKFEPFEYVELISANTSKSTKNIAIKKLEDIKKPADSFSDNQTSEDTTEELLHFKRKKSIRDSTRSPYTKNSKTIIAKRKEELNSREKNSTNISVRQRVLEFETFHRAQERGETENFRLSLVSVIDEEIENMKFDGYFQADTEEDVKCFVLNSEHEIDFEREDVSDEVIYDVPEQFEDHDKVAKHISTPDHYEVPPHFFKSATAQKKEIAKTTQYYSAPDDEFGEILFAEDLENGLYFVEAYNAENKELVIATLQVDRHCVYPNNISNVPVTDLLAEQSDKSNKTFVFLNQLIPSTSEISLNESNNSSNRNTIYSTTSGDSCFSFDDLRLTEDFEESSFSKHNSLYANQVRRETISDNKGIVRIERVYTEPSTLDGSKPNQYFSGFDQVAPDMYEYIGCVPLTPVNLTLNDTRKHKLDYLLEEIVSSEAKYVDDLRKIVEDYKPYIENHSDPNVSSKCREIFGNIEELYLKQQEFHLALEYGDGSLKDVVKAFIEFENLFKIYPKYISYKLKANFLVKEIESVVKERQAQLNDKLNLSAYLVTPVQRLGKYKLLLENILAQLKKEEKPIGSVTMALEIIKREMGKSNDAAAISSIQGCPVYEFGSFIMRDKFFCVKPKRAEVMVFLFEEIIVFATEDPKTIDLFYYDQSVKMCDLRINTSTNDDTTLHLIDYTKTKRKTFTSYKYVFVLEAPNKRVKETWRQAIEGILWKQLQFLKESTIQRNKAGRSSKRRPKPLTISSVASDSSMNLTNSRNGPPSTLTSTSSTSNTIPRTKNKHRTERAKSTETKNPTFSRESIQDCPFDISGYGDFILTDDFKVYKPKKMVLTAFLFEKIIIFTKANEDNSYYYVGSINMENVCLEPPNKSAKELRIKDHTNSVKFRKDIMFTLTALSENTQTKWRQAINRCLWIQFLKTKEQKLSKRD